MVVLLCNAHAYTDFYSNISVFDEIKEMAVITASTMDNPRVKCWVSTSASDIKGALNHRQMEGSFTDVCKLLMLKMWLICLCCN